MIRELEKYLKKYNEIAKNSEYVSVAQVTDDLYRLIMEARLKDSKKRKINLWHDR